MRKCWLAFGPKSLLSLVVAAGMACVLVACASTSQAKKTSTSGFLGDYSQLRPGKEGQAQLLFINPEAQFSAYTSILMDPISVYASTGDSALGKAPKDQIQELLNYLDATVRDKLSGDYTFVTTPGPGTMRLRIALTEAKGANPDISP
ncbi:MAG: DUF3313 domain-containing protein [Candidatus Hydrogenedentes bacterium]|nr:DUF3313 domain-containing protein [Candidatus Hydrogenedentota bacterium]